MFHPHIPKEAIDKVVDTLNSRWIGQGPKVELFEKKFGELFNVKYSVFLNSGSAALETAYELIGLKPGDEVISTPLTCTATNIPLLRMGVKIVWADIQENNLCLDPKDVQKKINEKTKAIVNVHLGGIENTLGEMPVPIVSDACQALGVFSGDYVCNSFQAIKQISTADGGMLTVRNEEEYKKAKLMRWFGIDREKKVKNNWQCYTERQMTFDIEVLGHKRQPTDIDASLVLVGLKYYYEWQEYRRKLYNIYITELSKVDGITVIDGEKNMYWLCTISVEKRRDDFAKMLFENHIDSNLVQIRNDVYKIFGGKRAELPIMNKIEDKYISIPIGMHVSEEDANYIVDVIKKGW
jgi:dTDP-4-amino-4,6-dideoxygalactose transaminase